VIEFPSEGKGKTIGIKVSGMLAGADYKQVLIPELEKKFAEYGKLRVLFYMDEGFLGWDLTAAWEDATVGLKHRAEFERLAVVGGPQWVHWCMRLSAFLIAGEIRIYAASRLEEAWTWIKGP
jgi:SpoIIAA-like